MPVQFGHLARTAVRGVAEWLAMFVFLAVVGVLLGVCVLKGPKVEPRPDRFKLFEDGGTGPGARLPVTTGAPLPEPPGAGPGR